PPIRRRIGGRLHRGTAAGAARQVSEAFFGDVADEVDTAVAVPPFVVIPAHQLEKPVVEADAAAGVVDRAVAVVNEVAGNDFVLRPREDPLEVGFARPLHRVRDFLVAGFLYRADGEVDNRYRGGRDAE